MAKVYQHKIHLIKPKQEYNSMPLTQCGLVFEPNDPIGVYNYNKKAVFYLNSKEYVPEKEICLSCLRIAGPCQYEKIRFY